MRARAAGLAGVLAAVLLATTAPPAPAAGPSAITLEADTVLPGDGRLHELTLTSAAVGTVHVRLLLPVGYDDPATADQRYPMLLLLHGAGGRAQDWTLRTDVETLAAATGLLVVMPDGGPVGFYSDWRQGPQWETFHIDQLVPWVDEHYRTTGARAGRVVAGNSMGGYGAMEYAARHPDLFVAAGSFSGAVDIAAGSVAESSVLQLLQYGGDDRWGPYASDEVVWRGHNPPDLATNLRWTNLALWTGDGVPSPGDNPAAGTLEAGIFLLNTLFDARLTAVGVDHAYVQRSGTHEWRYWEADLHAWLGVVAGVLMAPPAAPAAFDYRTVEPSASVYGWSFAVTRSAREFLDLNAVSPSGLTAKGSGSLAVETPGIYAPGERYSVAGAVPSTVAATQDGRLRFTVDLGPTHVDDQYSVPAKVAEALAGPAYWHTVQVSIAAAAPAPDAGATPAPAPPSDAVSARGTLPATGRNAPEPAIVALLVTAVVLRCGSGRRRARRTSRS